MTQYILAQPNGYVVSLPDNGTFSIVAEPGNATHFNSRAEASEVKDSLDISAQICPYNPATRQSHLPDYERDGWKERGMVAS